MIAFRNDRDAVDNIVDRDGDFSADNFFRAADTWKVMNTEWTKSTSVRTEFNIAVIIEWCFTIVTIRTEFDRF
jgi:hypothetical protein